MTNEEAIEAVQNVAINCASAEYAASIWEAGDWSWYQLMREMLLTAIEERRLPRFTREHERFLSFVDDHLAPHFPPGTLKKVMFLAHLRAPASDSARAVLPTPFSIDRCPVFWDR